MTRLAIAAVLVLLSLTGCVTPAGSGGWGDEDWGGGTVEPLSRGQQSALEDGCRVKYAGNSRKVRACVNQATDGWRGAMTLGCERRYPNDRKKLRECIYATQ